MILVIIVSAVIGFAALMLLVASIRAYCIIRAKKEKNSRRAVSIYRPTLLDQSTAEGIAIED